MTRAVGALVLSALVVATGCSSHKDSATKASTTTAPATAAPTSAVPDDSPQAIYAHGWPPHGAGGSCDGHVPGTAKILMTYCHGTAQIMLKLPEGTKVVKNGVCWINGTGLELDWGTATGEGFTGKMPDYLTLLMPSSPGPLDGSSAMFAFGGTPRYIPSTFGDVGDDLNHALPIAPALLPKVKGDFSGKDFASDYQFQATFNCDGPPPPLPTVQELIDRSKGAVPLPSKS